MNDKRDSILYIDDEQENLLGFKYVFKKFFKVYVAASASEGWEILKNNPIKVIITDQRMPKTTGVQLLEKVANEYPLVLRIILTGYTDVQDIIQAINKGKIYQFIRKPWNKDEVKVILDNAIKVYDLQSQNLQLIESLKITNAELAEVNRTLEKKVEERTIEIEDKNRELEKHRNNLEELVKQRTFELEIAKEKAEESDRLKSSFLANVTHEIRTPMNAIMGFSELMVSDDTYTHEELKEFKELIVLNSESLLRLIDDILDISSIEANQISISYSDQNLHKDLEELSMFYNEQKKILNKSDLEIKFEKPDGEDLLVSTDKIRLNQILSNLIGNALKFTEKGYVRFGYKLIQKHNSNAVLQFYIKDTGIGIPAEAQKYVFDRFRKVDIDSSKIFRGTGLGLCICKSLVEMFGGEIWIESVIDNGSVFYFEIPYIPASREIDDILLTDTDFINHKFDFRGKSILIAEDEDSSYYYIENVLRNTSAKLIRTKNGQETIDLVQSTNDLDLILMDIQMPVVSGYEAILTIKEKKKDIPIIVQTAYALLEQKDKILNSGCDAMISKPFKSSDLLNMIKKFI
jgi:signal transduction histidine kinase